MEKDESKKLRRPLFQASSFFLSRSLSRFVIENVDGLIFRDISFQFFSRKMGENKKTSRLSIERTMVCIFFDLYVVLIFPFVKRRERACFLSFFHLAR